LHRRWSRGSGIVAFVAILGDLRRLAVLVAVTLLGVALTQWLAIDHHNFDIRVYDGAVKSWAGGGDLYAYTQGGRHLGFTYPPFAALLMLPMALFPLAVVIGINAFLMAVTVVIATRLVLGSTFLAVRHGAWFATITALPVVVLTQPIRDTLSFGQVNVYLALLVLADLVALRRGFGWAGVGVGLATAIKLTPGLFVVLFLLTKQGRAARTAMVTAAGATVLAAVVAPGTSWTFWTSALLDPSRVGRYDDSANQSIAGVFARLNDSHQLPLAPWLLAVLVVLPLGLARARQAWRRGDGLAAVTLVGLTAGLVSPITWVHHLFWLVPAVVLLVDVGLIRRSWPPLLLAASTVVLFASGVNIRLGQSAGHHLSSGFAAIGGENGYAVCCLLLLLVVPTDRMTRTTSLDMAWAADARGRMRDEEPTRGTAGEREQPPSRRGPREGTADHGVVVRRRAEPDGQHG
jgi:alpha-1,2-mannosyltransferase